MRIYEINGHRLFKTKQNLQLNKINENAIYIKFSITFFTYIMKSFCKFFDPLDFVWSMELTILYFHLRVATNKGSF